MCIRDRAEFCSMCGPKHCPMNSKISDESLDQLKDKLEECNTQSSYKLQVIGFPSFY